TDEHLIDDVEYLAQPHVPDIIDTLAKDLENRTDLFQDRLSTAHHHGQRAAFGPVDATAHRRIDDAHLPRGGSRRDPLDDHWRRSAKVDDRPARPHPLDHPFGTEVDLEQLLIGREATHHNVALLGHHQGRR